MYNKVDVCSMEEVDEIARRPHSIPISCYQKLNLDGLLERIWDMMVSLLCCLECIRRVLALAARSINSFVSDFARAWFEYTPKRSGVAPTLTSPL